MRLNQFVARTGICARRKAEKLIAQGCIHVNGKVADHPGIRVGARDCVTYLGRELRLLEAVYMLLNKPMNCITTLFDSFGRKTIKDHLPKNLPGVYPVGRLDRNTVGALMVTNDGDLARALSHPSQGVAKTYEVILKRPLRSGEYNSIQKGILLEDGRATVDAVHFLDKERKHVKLRLHSGKNRIIRRIFEVLGHQVMSLERVAFAGLTLDGLHRGQWRHLGAKEVLSLKRMVFGRRFSTGEEVA